MAAVSIQFTPSSTARRIEAMDFASSCGPHPYAQPPPPAAQAPKPTVLISRPDRPSCRLFNCSEAMPALRLLLLHALTMSKVSLKILRPNTKREGEFRGKMEARVGFEPTNGGFADLSLGPLGYRAASVKYNETKMNLHRNPHKFE